MRLLVVGQHYWPEPFDLSVDICENLVQLGHEVTMLTGMPNYPHGDFYPGYEENRDCFENRNGVRILRTHLHPRKTGAFHRIWNYYSFSHNASKAVKRLNDSYDVVISLASSPVMMANPAIRYANKHGCPLLMYVIDIWPECLTAGGIKRGSLIYRHYKTVACKIYEQADKLLVTSPRFIEYLRETVGVTRPTTVLPQFVEDEDYDNVNPEDSYDSARFNITFAGNIGRAQSVDTIVRAAEKLGADSGIVIHVVGDGSEFSSCVKMSNDLQLKNIVFHGRHSSDEMPAFFKASDAMLATFANDATLAFTLPRKMQSYMAAGKPIVAAVSGEARHVIEEAGCGLCCAPEDVEGLAAICLDMAQSGNRQEYASAARSYYEEHYSKRVFFEILQHELDSLEVRGIVV